MGTVLERRTHVDWVADPIGGFDLRSQTKISGAPVPSTMPGAQVRDYGLAGANLGPPPADHPSVPSTPETRPAFSHPQLSHSELAPQIPHFVVDLRTLSPDHRYKGSTKRSCRLIPFVFKIFPVNPLNSKI